MANERRAALLETHPHLKDFLPYLDVLNKESGRGKVLVSCSFLEQQLEAILRAFMRENDSASSLVEGPNAPVGSFYTLSITCHALGLISDVEMRELTLLRKIRNDFAHDVLTTFETPAVKNRCRELTLKAPDYLGEGGEPVVLNAEGQFTTAAVSLIMGFTNRAHYVSRTRRTEIAWKL